MRFGVNLRGTEDLLRKNPEELFKAIKDMGYRYVEPCYTSGEEGRFKEVVRAARACGLEVENAEVDDWEEETLVHLAQSCGLRHIILRLPSDMTEERYPFFRDFLLRCGERLKPLGASVLLAHGKQEIMAAMNGKPVLIHLVESCDGLVKLQADVDTVFAGGWDPEEFLWTCRESIHSVVYKAMNKEDAEAVFQFARAEECVQYVERNSLAQLKDAIDQLQAMAQIRPHTSSILCVYDTETDQVTELKRYEGVIEAPNWMPQEERLVYNAEGRLYFYDMKEGTDTLINTGICTSCNNDHVLAVDGSGVAVSHFCNGVSLIYTIPFATGMARQVTPVGHSWLHGWSPDLKELAYCAFRKDTAGKMRVNIHAISAEGGEEWALTDDESYNDGAEYAPDGKTIWFISDRTGLMQVYRMERDGSNPTQMTFENRNNWFGHISPDNRKVVNLAYSKDGLDSNQHLPNMHVSLWLMDANGHNRRKILDFFGGQGSINVNSWASDSRRFAFVKYELHHKEKR